jgi:hypothetical protein
LHIATGWSPLPARRDANIVARGPALRGLVSAPRLPGCRALATVA